MKYLILQGTVHGQIQTVLVLEESFKDDGGPPSDYFVGDSKAKVVGSVEMDGDVHLLDDIYESPV
jgi:hypothetical protein